jgi:hypothetical protein
MSDARAAHMQRMLRARATVYALALGIVGAVVAGAWLHAPVVLFGGPLVVVGAVATVCWMLAGRRAEEEFFRSFARTRRFSYAPRTQLMPLTPLLAAGDRHECRHWMEGPLGDGAQCGLGHYAFQMRHGSGRHKRRRSHHFTICVVDVEQAIVMYPGIFLARRLDLVDRVTGEAWLDTANRRSVELESESLCERCELWVERSQDDVRLLELFSPSFVAWLADHPLRPCFEYRAGTLVVYLERRVEDAGHLTWMLEATAEIARRLRREVREAAGSRAA